MLAVALDGPAPALGQWVFPSRSSPDDDLAAIGPRKVGLTQDVIQFPDSPERLFVVERLCLQPHRYTYIGLRQRRITEGRPVSASGAGIWLKNSILDGSAAAHICAALFEGVWPSYDAKFYQQRIDMGRLRGEFPIIDSILNSDAFPELPLTLKTGLGFQGTDSYCVLDVTSDTDTDGLHRGLLLVQKTEVLADFRRVLLSDDPYILQAIKHPKLRLTLGELERLDRDHVRVPPAVPSRAPARQIGYRDTIRAATPMDEKQIRQIVRQELAAAGVGSSGARPLLDPPSVRWGWLTNGYSLVKPINIALGFLCLVLIVGVGVVALKVFGLAPPPIVEGPQPTAKAEPDKRRAPVASSTNAAQSTTATTIDNSQTVTAEALFCNVADVKQTVEDLLKTLGPPKDRGKMTVDAVRRAIDKLNKSVAGAANQTCDATSSTASRSTSDGGDTTAH